MSPNRFLEASPRIGWRHLICLPVLSVLALALSGLSAQADTALKELLGISSSHLPGRYNGVSPEAFDVSPDGKTIAIEFEAGEGNRIWGIWVAEWDVPTKRLLVRRRVEGPAPPSEILPNPQYTLNVAFSPDGRKLAVQTGTHIRVLDPATLVDLYTIAPPETRSASKEGIALRRLAFSGDSLWMVVTSSAAASPWEPCTVRLFDTANGQEAAEWSISAGCPASLSLSPDGRRLLMASFAYDCPPKPGTPDVILVEARTGAVLRRFHTGYGTRVGYGAAEAQFISPDRFIATSGPSTDASGRYSGYSLKVFDTSSAQVVGELAYPPYGVRGQVAVAREGQVLAVLTYWENPEDIRRDLDGNAIRGFSRLLLFRLTDREPFYASPDLHLLNLPLSTVRISTAGTTVGILESGTVKVYEVAKPGLTTLARERSSRGGQQ